MPDWTPEQDLRKFWQRSLIDQTCGKSTADYHWRMTSRDLLMLKRLFMNTWTPAAPSVLIGYPVDVDNAADGVTLVKNHA